MRARWSSLQDTGTWQSLPRVFAGQVQMLLLQEAPGKAQSRAALLTCWTGAASSLDT